MGKTRIMLKSAKTVAIWAAQIELQTSSPRIRRIDGQISSMKLSVWTCSQTSCSRLKLEGIFHRSGGGNGGNPPVNRVLNRTVTAGTPHSVSRNSLNRTRWGSSFGALSCRGNPNHLDDSEEIFSEVFFFRDSFC